MRATYKTLIFIILIFGCNSYSSKISDRIHIDTDREKIVKEKGYFIDKNPDGEWKGWYSKNRLAFDIHFKNGKRDGNWKYFYPNGNLQINYNYKNDTSNGLNLAYHKNGLVYTKCTYKNGQLVGDFITYYSNGFINCIKVRDSIGNSCKEVTIFNEQGKICNWSKYNDGKIDYTIVYLDNSTPIMKKITEFELSQKDKFRKVEYILDEKKDTVKIIEYYK